MDSPPPDLIPTQLSLLNRLKDWNDQKSWQAFFDTYWRLIYSVARQAGLADAEAQDVVQETVIAAAKAMPDFKYDPALGSFKGWLLQLTGWRIQDQLRKQQYQKDGKRFPRAERASTSLLHDQPDPAGFALEKIWDDEWHKNHMETALSRVKAKVRGHVYQLFYFHVCKKMTAQVVADRFEVKQAEVYYARLVVSRLLLKELKRLENEML